MKLRSALLLVASLVFATPSAAQHRVLVKFRATPTVSRAVQAYTPASVGTPDAVGAGKVDSPFTGLGAVDDVLRSGHAFQKAAVIPRLAQEKLRARLPAAKRAAFADLMTLTEFRFPESANLELILARLRALDEVVYAEERPVYRATPTHRAGPAGGARILAPERLTPNDPRYSALWGQHNTGQTGGTPDADTDAPEAWEIQTGSPDVVVAVLDSGIDYTHPDIAPNVWTNPGEIPGNGLDDDANGYVDDVHGFDFFHGDADPMDDNMHGTHVAGTIGARGNNGIGVTGMAWDVKLIGVKFLGPSGSGSEAFEAVTYALVTGAPISNNSWGGGSQSEAFVELMQMAEDAGHLFIAAAGNDSVEDLHYPAAYDQAMAVASTNHQDRISGFSNFGTWVEISAPGSAILSTVPAGAYGQLSGTSMATPQVSGVAALLKAEHPDWTAAQIRVRLRDTADSIDHLNPGFEGKLGSGRLNAHAALLPATPRIQLAAVRVDDDQFGSSAGNLDGAAGPGETIELWIDLSNVGALAAEGVTAELTAQDALVQVADADYGALPFLSTGIASAAPFRFFIPEAVAAGTTIALTLDVTDAAGGAWTLPITLPVTEPASITGTVTDVATALPIGNARIDFAGSRTDFVLSESDGSYRISDILVGETVLHASATGYVISDPVSVTASSGTTIDFRLGAPVLEIPVLPPITEPWGETTTASLPVANTGTDSLSVDLIEMPAGTMLPLETLRVGIVRSTSNRSAARTWSTLEQDFGPVPLDVDATSLASGEITLSRIQAAGIDVLFVGPPKQGDALSAAEVEVIRAFVEAGGALVASGALNSDAAPAATQALADILGLEPTFPYVVESEPSRFEAGPAAGLGRRLDYPYASASQNRSAPSEVDWPGALVTATAAMTTADGRGVVTTRSGRIFLAHPAENSSLRADRQLVYNVIVHAAFDVPWLDLAAGALDLAPTEATSAELLLDVSTVDPGGSAEAALLVRSNAAPDRLLPIVLVAGSAARLEATVQADLRAGTRSDITLTILNTGDAPAPASTVELTTASSHVAISGSTVLPMLNPGASTSVQVPADVSAEAPHDTPVLLRTDIAAPGGLSWRSDGRVTIARTSVVSGLVVSSTGAVADEPVTWTGAAEGSTRTAADGTFSAELPDGTYLLSAGGAQYAQSAPRLITVPPDTAGVRFALTRPGVTVSPAEVAATLAPWETAVPTVTVTSTGDDPVTFHADFVPSGLSSRLGELLQDPPPADPPVAGPETDWTWGRLLILQDQDPLGSGITEPLLQAHGVPYDILPSAAMGALDLSPYTKVLLSSNQPAAFANGLETHRQWLEDWVAAGGVLQLHLAFNNNFNEIVGGLKRTQDFGTDLPVLTAPTHPTYQEPSVLSVQELAPLTPVADGYFERLPPHADTLLVWEHTGLPITVELPFGNGAILATNHLVEDSRPYHENMLLYRLRRPAWTGALPAVSERLEVGSSTAVSVPLAGPSPGSSEQAWLRLRTTDATQPEVIVPVRLSGLEAPTLEVAGVEGILNAGETAELALTLRNAGTLGASGVTLSIGAATRGFTVLTPSVTVGSVDAGGTATASVQVAVDPGIADGSVAVLAIDLSGDGGLAQSLSAEVTMRNDTDPPLVSADLTLIRAYRSGGVVRFTEPGDDCLNGAVGEIEFRYGTQPIASSADFEAATVAVVLDGLGGGQPRSTDVTGLPEGTTVHLAFRATDSAGNTSDVSNSVEVATAPAVDVTVTSVAAGMDGRVGAGDLLFLNLELVSMSGEVLPGVTVSLAAPFDAHLFVDSGRYAPFASFVGDVGADPVTASVQASVSSLAPVGVDMDIGLVVLGGDGLPLDRASHRLTVETTDMSAPFVTDTRFLAGIYALGSEVPFSGNVSEPGPVVRTEAIIQEDGAEVARVPMTQGDDGRWSGSWTVDRQGEFLVGYEAEDVAGNTGSVLGGAYQGFSTVPFRTGARNLLIVDAVSSGVIATDFGMVAALRDAGLSVDAWLTAIHGRQVPVDVLSAYQGSVVHVSPGGSFNTLGNFGAEAMRLALSGHLGAGGSVMLAANGLFDALPPEWLSAWFGAVPGGTGSGSVIGVAGDVVGDGIVLEAGSSGWPGGGSAVDLAGGVAAFEFEDGTIAGARLDTGTFRSVILGVGPQELEPSAAGALVSRIVTWMSGDPLDDVPPAAVNSLRARVEAGDVVLTWLATGDDGREGRAMGYELRYAATPPGQDWQAWWAAATPVPLGRPADAFADERVVVSGLDVAANWFFLLRAEDDGRNLSPLSNLARVAPGHPTGLEDADLPGEFDLHAAYPNPFAASTRIGFSLPEAARVRLEVFDVLGRRVAQLVNAQRAAGRYEVAFTAAGLASGLYLVRMDAGGSAFSQPVLLVR